MGKLGMCGTDGSKFGEIRAHMQRAIGNAYPNSRYDLSFEAYPKGDKRDYDACVRACSHVDVCARVCRVCVCVRE